MNQSTVTVRINGQPYQMGCDVGQENHIEEMGRNVDSIVQQLVVSVGQIGDARLLAMAGLILADQVQTANQQAGVISREPPITSTEDNRNVHTEDSSTLTSEQKRNILDQIITMAQTIENLAQSQE